MRQAEGLLPGSVTTIQKPITKTIEDPEHVCFEIYNSNSKITVNGIWSGVYNGNKEAAGNNYKGETMAEDNNNTVEYENKTEYRTVSPAGRATAAFALGIASIVLCVIPFMIIAAIVGLTFERESEMLGYHKLQTPARILCIIGIVMCALAIAAIIILVFVMGILGGK